MAQLWEVAEAVSDKALQRYLSEGWEPIGAQRVEVTAHAGYELVETEELDENTGLPIHTMRPIEHEEPPAHVVWYLRRPKFGAD